MASNNKKHESTGLEYAFFIFGIGLTAFSIIFILKDPEGFSFFVRPRGQRLTGLPGIFILIIGLVMTYYSFKEIFLPKRNK